MGGGKPAGRVASALVSILAGGPLPVSGVVVTDAADDAATVDDLRTLVD